MRIEAGEERSFLERFSYFEDGALVGVELSLRSGVQTVSIVADVIDVVAMRQRAVDDSGPPECVWCRVRLTVDGVAAYQFLGREPSTYAFADGIQLAVEDELCVLDLSPAPGPDWAPDIPGPGSWTPEAVYASMNRAPDFAGYSSQFVVGRSIGFTVSEIR
ncbi:hypothetical protein [Nocardia sp. NPDC004415]